MAGIRVHSLYMYIRVVPVSNVIKKRILPVKIRPKKIMEQENYSSN